jgi:hypothetical protein
VKRIILNQFDVRKALETGRVVVRKAMRPDPQNNTRLIATCCGVSERDFKRGRCQCTHPKPLEWINSKDSGSPLGLSGDKVWVAETFFLAIDKVTVLGFAADMDYPHGCGYYKKSSFHMPQWASRLTLEIEAVRVEKLQEWVYEMKRLQT